MTTTVARVQYYNTHGESRVAVVLFDKGDPMRWEIRNAVETVLLRSDRYFDDVWSALRSVRAVMQRNDV